MARSLMACLIDAAHIISRLAGGPNVELLRTGELGLEDYCMLRQVLLQAGRVAGIPFCPNYFPQRYAVHYGLGSGPSHNPGMNVAFLGPKDMTMATLSNFRLQVAVGMDPIGEVIRVIWDIDERGFVIDDVIFGQGFEVVIEENRGVLDVLGVIVRNIPNIQDNLAATYHPEAITLGRILGIPSRRLHPLLWC